LERGERIVRVLVMGVTGMLGHASYRVFGESAQLEVWGTLRADESRRYFSQADQARLVSGVDVLDEDLLAGTLERIAPDVVVNCVGLIKQMPGTDDPLVALPINAMLPHRLARQCASRGARVVHISTDCVFSGRKGMYSESDASDAEDLYGRSKYIGELGNQSNAITLRTSMIGHELNSKHSLVEWFLSQTGRIHGYTRAIFSGLPTVELARLVRDRVLPRADLHGVYHVSAKPISKFALLNLVAAAYGKKIEISPDASVVIDRSLDSSRFSNATGYVAPEWPELIQSMHRDWTTAHV
jgi:dTDP-4-dehydrorhamnose reductase